MKNAKIYILLILLSVGVFGVFNFTQVGAQFNQFWSPDSSDLPFWNIEGVTDGCAEWSSDSLTTTGSACGGGGGATALDDIADPDANSIIEMTSFDLTFDTAGASSTLVIDGGAGTVAIGNGLVISGDTIKDFANQAGLADGDSANVDSDSGLEVISNSLTLLRGCSDNQILKWDETQDDWNCEADGGGGSTNLDSIGDPTASSTIEFASTTWTIDTAGASSTFILDGGAGFVSMVTLTFTGTGTMNGLDVLDSTDSSEN